MPELRQVWLPSLLSDGLFICFQLCAYFGILFGLFALISRLKSTRNGGVLDALIDVVGALQIRWEPSAILKPLRSNSAMFSECFSSS